MNPRNETTGRRPQRYVVAKVDEIPPGERLIVDVGGREIGIFNLRGEFFAMLNRCPHVGGPLCRGQLVNRITSTGPGEITLDEGQDLLTCPWHNWEFDLRTGQSYWDPKKMRARPFTVSVEQGESVCHEVTEGSVGRVEGPYRAETVEVGVESDYVVLSLRPQRRDPKPSLAQPGGPAGTATTALPQSLVPEGNTP